jgi:NAD(P)-dependent dehydrogenase (short-subunit alcohol dehydrogenase family)
MTDQKDIKGLLFAAAGLKPGECAGRVVVITGAGRGIGLQAARAFAALGGSVVIAEISNETGKAAEVTIRSEGGEALFVQTDVSDARSVQNLRQAVHSGFGPVDILVNNAIRCPFIPVADMDEAQWDQVLAVNLRGTFLVSKAFLPEMVARGSGIILNMVSLEAMPGLSAYIASKQGILGFSQTLALEAGSSGINVIPFGPGMVDTPAIQNISADLAPRLGMTQEQFLHIPLHTAYDSLMPAEHAGVATAYLALRLADEFHGQAVNGYEVLERAGLIQATPISPAETAGPAVPPARVSVAHVQAQVDALLEILAATGKEFEKLPVFVRPMARGGFKGKSGQSLESWQRSLSVLKERLEKGSREGVEASLVSLDKLVDYYRGVPRETGRFTRDQEMLRQVAELSEQRIDAIQRLQAGLRGIAGES